MTFKPADTAQWATGGTNIQVPTSGKKIVGFDAATGERPPGEYVNYLHSIAGLWHAMLDALFSSGGALTLPTSQSLTVTGSTSLAALSASGNATVTGTLGVTGLVTTNAIAANGLISAAAGVTAASNQHVTVSGTGDFKHGTWQIALHPCNFSLLSPGVGAGASSLGSILRQTWIVDARSSGSGETDIVASIPIRTGDRLASIQIQLFGAGSGFFTVESISTAGVISSIRTVSSMSWPGAGNWGTITAAGIGYTMGTSEVISVRLTGTVAAGISEFGLVILTFDHP